MDSHVLNDQDISDDWFFFGNCFNYTTTTNIQKHQSVLPTCQFGHILAVSLGPTPEEWSFPAVI